MIALMFIFYATAVGVSAYFMYPLAQEANRSGEHPEAAEIVVWAVSIAVGALWPVILVVFVAKTMIILFIWLFKQIIIVIASAALAVYETIYKK